MLIERLLMKLFAPRRLARRDVRWVYEAIDGAPKHQITGYAIGIETMIPTGDLARLLLMMEASNLIERGPGPRDAPRVRSVMASWWNPGHYWPDLVAEYGDEQ